MCSYIYIVADSEELNFSTSKIPDTASYDTYVCVIYMHTHTISLCVYICIAITYITVIAIGVGYLEVKLS